MIINLESIKNEQNSFETVKNDINKDLNEIIHSLESVEDSINSELLNTKLHTLKENYISTTLNMKKSLDNINNFINKQIVKYSSINETTKVSLDDLIEMLDAIENPLKAYLKEEETYE